VDFDPRNLDPKDRDALLRWRLALGPGAEQTSAGFGLAGLESAAGALGVDPVRVKDLDGALSFVYDDGGSKSAGAGRSRPYLPDWLAALRDFFSHDVVALVQKDAIDRKGLTQLLFEPETLPFLERNVELVATLVAAKGMIPDRAREAARQIVREVVDELRKQLESETRTAILGALRRDRHSPLRVLRNLDWQRTIRRNLRGWDRERRRLVPERLHFWANQRRHHEWDVALAVDQSGSMATSVVYSSIMAAIFASLDVLKTRLVFFDTEVVDATPLLTDPVELIFSSQLGGGTDIQRAVAYVQDRLVERPDRTLFVLVTDLFEGGDRGPLLSRLRQLADARVKTLVLLALTDQGKPSYDHDTAQQIQALGIPCFGSTPRLLVRVVERVMKGQDLTPLLAAEAK
jgi:hypothetical protein